ncbi:DUF2249 domain-containing protein [Nocardioides mesophilus]|uniref:DUF2249 domain-containing protein n=1 Tax=Nocardioides mesophilus TaxID=433659 RepID=A0A7G9R764_9ACTN|nr:DUF2249 domain-containing protein [Nocardioides mesophilus]QNN51439.1 DUF2249 domain-containing protein [Nocardioides mesophilus]
MNDVVIASTEADAAAAAAVEQHHAQMAGALALRVETLVDAAARADEVNARAALADLTGWCEHELVPHALAEEQAMYPAARAKPEGRLLVDGMLAEHVVITGLVRDLTGAADPVRAAATARALQVIFDSHLAKENELVLPLLAAAPDVSVADLLGGMHELLGGHEHGHEHGAEQAQAGEPAGGCGGACGCGEVDGPGYPELDARGVPHAIRHATIFGALEAVAPGGGLVLVAPHDPVPLLAQVEQRSPGRFAVEYLERGPEAWRIAFVRRTAA